MEYSPPPFFKRGPNLLTRLTLFSLLSLVLLFADARFRYMDDVRSVVGVILYPLQELVDTPTRMGRGILGYFSLQTTLRSENTRLREEAFVNAGLLQKQEALIMENIQMQFAERASIRYDDDTINRVLGNMAQDNNEWMSHWQPIHVGDEDDSEDDRAEGDTEAFEDEAEQAHAQHHVDVEVARIDRERADDPRVARGTLPLLPRARKPRGGARCLAPISFGHR